MHAQLRGPQAGPVPVLQSRAGAPKEGEDVADGGFPAGGFGQREVCLDPVAVAAAVFLLHHLAGCGQAGDDAVATAFGDARAGRDVAEPHARVAGNAQQHLMAWLVRKR